MIPTRPEIGLYIIFSQITAFTAAAITYGRRKRTWNEVRVRGLCSIKIATKRPIATGIVKKSSVHLTLFPIAVQKMGSEKISRKLRSPTKFRLGATPSQSVKEVMRVYIPGISTIMQESKMAGARRK